MAGIALFASMFGAAAATDERNLRRNPTMKRMEERIGQLEQQLVKERQERRTADMLSGLISMREFEATKRRLRYSEYLIHFAVAGSAGSGKSSLINAIRGLRNSDPGAAQVGTSETTMEVQRYEHPDAPRNPFVWYDIPGAGTLSQNEVEYFRKQGLYIFDCVFVLFDTRFTATDIAILRCCHEMNIPTYIVRSKALQHIKNIIDDTATSADDDDDGEESGARWTKARAQYIEDTEQTVKNNLKAAGLDDQRVYIVDKMSTLQVALGVQNPKHMIHERELLLDAVKEMVDKRFKN